MSEINSDNHIRRYKIKLVIAGFIALGLSTGILINSIGQFILPINEDMGYSVGSVSLAFSIICAGIIFAATTVAKFIDRYSCRACMAISTGVLAVFTFLISFTTEIWQFYLCTVVIGLAFTGLHTLPVSVMINRAFSPKRKGLAISIAFSGSGIGGMVFNPFFNYIIGSHGWRMGFVAIAGIYFIGGLLIVWLAKAPKDIKAYDEHIESAEFMVVEASGSYLADSVHNVESIDMEYKDAIKTGIFIRLVICIMFVNGIGSALMMHTVPYMVEIGVTSSAASFFISLCLLVLAVNKIVLGYICDKFGVERGTIFGVICYIFGLFVMIALQISQWIYLAFIFLGTMGLAMPTVTAPLLVSHLFGNRDYTRIFGTTMIFMGIGNSFFPSLMGFIFDITGSYVIGWTLFAWLLIFSLILYIINFKKYKELFSS